MPKSKEMSVELEGKKTMLILRGDAVLTFPCVSQSEVTMGGQKRCSGVKMFQHKLYIHIQM